MKENGIIGSLRIRARTLFHKHSLPRWSVFIVDCALVVGTFFISYFLRFNFEPSAIDFALALEHSVLVLAVFIIFELVFRSFAGLIRHTTIQDVFNVMLTTTSTLLVLSSLTFLSRHFGWTELVNIPVSIILIHYVTVTAFMFIMRIMVKMFYEVVSAIPVAKKNVVIFGAGAMGLIVKRVIYSDPSREYRIIAFLDNNRKLQSKDLEGIPVLRPGKLNRDYLKKHGIGAMIFAIRDISTSEKSEIFKFALGFGLEVLEVPPINHWLNGQFNIKQLKKIRVEDLLRREAIHMNMSAIARGLKGKTVVVTGAAGSIGSEIVRQLTVFDTERIVLIDNAETPMFHLERELLEHYPHAPVKTCLADVTDPHRMEWLFRSYEPDVVFHAAAYKHLPLLEENPKEAIRVNVGGTMLLTKLSQKYGVEKFVLVSSDKAVNPTNVLGASKRMCEIIMQARNMEPGNRVRFVVTRFGNVLGSSGSVIPLFQKQIEEGGPVTVTHPDVTRFFMTIPEACQLVLEAGFMGIGGEIFIFDMGEPVKIADLAEQMIRLSGLEPGKDIKIEYVGLRPGEKLFEELLTDREKVVPTYNPKVKVAEMAVVDLGMVMSAIHRLHYTYTNLADHELIERMTGIVPEFVPANDKYNHADGAESIEMEAFPD